MNGSVGKDQSQLSVGLNTLAYLSFMEVVLRFGHRVGHSWIRDYANCVKMQAVFQCSKLF